MNETTLSTKTLKAFFNFRKQYLDTMVIFILCFLKGQTTNVRQLSLLTNAKVQIDSAYKRLLRFLRNVTLCQIAVAKLIIQILAIDPSQKHIIVIDRTYWMFGRVHLNFLYLSILINGYAIPIFFVLCGPDKKGHSSLAERTTLFEYFDKVLGFDQIEYALADREFMGADWLKFLQSKGIKFVQRCKDKRLYVSNKRGEMVLVAQLLHDLKPGEQTYLGLRRIGNSNPFFAHLTALRTPDNEIVLLAHAEEISDPCLAYRYRWKIELCFRSLKSHGFNLEDTSITQPNRICNLLLLANIAFALAFVAGQTLAKLKPVKRKKHGRQEMSLVKLALYYMTCFFNHFSCSYFSLAHIVSFSKNTSKRAFE